MQQLTKTLLVFASKAFILLLFESQSAKATIGSCNDRENTNKIQEFPAASLSYLLLELSMILEGNLER
jgi:hypothetical protein